METPAPPKRPTVSQLRAALDHVRASIVQITDQPVPGDPRLSAGIAYASLKRAINVLTAVEAVAGRELVSEVRGIGRVLSESFFDLAWILQKGGVDRDVREREACAERLFDDSRLDGARIVVDWVRFGYGVPENATEAKRLIAEIRAKYELKPKQPLLKDLRARAKEAGGTQFDEHYSLFYSAMCLDAHASIQAITWALKGLTEHEFERNLFMVLAVTLALTEVALQLLGHTTWRAEYAEIVAEVERQIGRPFTTLPPATE